MRRDGDRLLPEFGAIFEGGAGRFLFKGTNGRWRSLLGPEELALYDARVAADLPADCARWLEGGRLAAGDPSPAAAEVHASARGAGGGDPAGPVCPDGDAGTTRAGPHGLDRDRHRGYRDGVNRPSCASPSPSPHRGGLS